MLPQNFNPKQPIRDRHDENGEILRFRTRPRNTKNHLSTDKVDSKFCQMRLYRAVRAGEVPIAVTIADLYQWINYPDTQFSSNVMGKVILDSVAYEPRRTKTSRTEKAASTYLFKNIKDLQFGLEWQMCLWLETFTLLTSGVSVVDLEEELDELALCPEDEYLEIYENEMRTFEFRRIDWREVAIRQGPLFYEENIPEETRLPSFRQKPRDLSRPAS